MFEKKPKNNRTGYNKCMGTTVNNITFYIMALSAFIYAASCIKDKRAQCIA